MAAVGLVVGIGLGLFNLWQFSAITGWCAAALTYLLWVWLSIGKLDAPGTEEHATREDPARGTTDILVLFASVASLVAVVVLLAQAKSENGVGKELVPILGIASVVLSWFLVHTLFTLRYARLFYTGRNGGIDFNQKDDPRYIDFAYLAFTLGMTFQVSDTSIQNFAIRSTALRHGLLSYLFGSVILAATINLVAGLAS
jgi:uncharacterized membrane protein